ncbi:MAG: B12-binding domain-containing radical SAM protein [Candidatus Thorarchaeota archaeon]
MKILIVDALAANEGRRKFSRDTIGVGPRLLAGICDKNSIFSKIVRVEDLLEKEVLSISDFNHFLISAMSVDKIAVNRVIKLIRKKNNSAFILLGGPIASNKTELEGYDIDIAVIGEGERILNELILNNFSIDNLSSEINIIKREGKINLILKKEVKQKEIFKEFYPSTSHITDYPDYWYSKVYVEIVRGCSNHYRGEIVRNEGGCSDCGNCDSPDSVLTDECPENIPPGCGFCSVPATFGPPRSKPIELIVDEVQSLFENGVRRVILSAPGFLDYYRNPENEEIFSPTKPSANIEKISELLTNLANVRDNQKHKCSISIENIKPSLVTPKTAEIIGKFLPNTSISIGCETFDEKHSDQIGRPPSPKKALEAAKLFMKNNIHPQIYLIHSLPGETVQTLEKTKDVVMNQLKDYAEKITVYKYLPLPNSPFTMTNTPFPVDRHLQKVKREELKKSIINFNLEKKHSLVDTYITSIVAEKDRTREKTYICYPLYSGPAISVKTEKDILGKLVKILIIGVVSDKLVSGKIVKIIENIV